MSKDNNLHDFLQDVADAIRKKKGSNEPINAQNFADEILSIKSGGDGVVAEKDIRFYDYDGTLLYSYTIEEAQALKELPPLPSHEGLICQEWNWDYEDVIALDRPMDIGATYITDDGKTRLYIRITTSKNIDINISQNVEAGVSIDWGDGGALETFPYVASERKITHKYSKSGKYLITFTPLENCQFSIGSVASKASNIECEELYIGKNVTKLLALRGWASLKYVTIPNNVISWTSPMFYECYSLRQITLPKNVTQMSGTFAGNCFSLRSVSFPANAKGEAGYIADRCYLITRLTFSKPMKFLTGSASYTSIDKFVFPIGSEIPGSAFAFNDVIPNIDCTGVTSMSGNGIFEKCRNLKYAILPRYLEALGDSTFIYCSTLKTVVFPENLLSLPRNMCLQTGLMESFVCPPTIINVSYGAFYASGISTFYDFTACIQVPTLENTNAFQSIPSTCEIRVPEDLYDDWVAATNWATYADRIKAYPRTTYDYDALVAEARAMYND